MRPAATLAEQRALLASGWRMDGLARADRQFGRERATIRTDGGWLLTDGTRSHWSQVGGGILAAATAAESAANGGE